jgi:hypothetical protein
MRMTLEFLGPEFAKESLLDQNVDLIVGVKR